MVFIPTFEMSVSKEEKPKIDGKAEDNKEDAHISLKYLNFEDLAVCFIVLSFSGVIVAELLTSKMLK